MKVYKKTLQTKRFLELQCDTEIFSALCSLKGGLHDLYLPTTMPKYGGGLNVFVPAILKSGGLEHVVLSFYKGISTCRRWGEGTLLWHSCMVQRVITWWLLKYIMWFPYKAKKELAVTASSSNLRSKFSNHQRLIKSRLVT